MDEEYAEGEVVAQSTTYAYTRANSPAGLLDLKTVGLQKLSKLSVCECVKNTDAKGKETGVQSANQCNIQSETQISPRQSIMRWLGCDDPGTCLCERA